MLTASHRFSLEELHMLHANENWHQVAFFSTDSLIFVETCTDECLPDVLEPRYVGVDTVYYRHGESILKITKPQDQLWFGSECGEILRDWLRTLHTG